MTKKLFMLLITVLLAAAVALAATNGYGPGDGSGNNCRFIDEDGDGINDNFRDHDGDGIPNHLDKDWTRPKDGSGYKNKYGSKSNSKMRNQNRRNLGSFQYRNNFGGFGNGECNGSGQLNGG
ncbi:MAG: hypothetical protein KAT34_14165, partial [Candidatus Aminicenantes bacterium]|nr:hypothetical protein [Candidatus Aminicenantes bacterium]